MIEEIKFIIKILLIIFVVVNVAMALRPIRQKLEYTLFIWKKFRIKMLFEVILLVLITVGIVIFLFYIPFLQFGWLNLFISSGGSVLITPIQEESNSSNLFFRLLVPIFFFALILALPSLAKIEEDIFRKGYIEWSDITRQSIKFGFAHLIVGVPLAAAIALIFVGIFYGYKYRKAYFNYYEAINDKQTLFNIEKQAVVVSTTYHTLCNSILIGSMLIMSLFYV